jgi:hypothetical protein
MGINQFKTDIKSALSDALDYNRYQTFFVKLEDSSTKLARELSYGSKSFGNALETSIFNAMQRNQDFNLEMKDTVEMISEYANETGRIPTIQQETIDNAVYLNKLTGIGTKELIAYTAEFSKIGMGQQQAQIYLTRMYKTAKGFGVNAAQLTKEVMGNLEKTNTYQFKNGVQGLTNMVARAKQLGIDFKETMKLAEDALDPDRAIEMASSMQMLGGNVGALGDPFKLLHMAQNDIEGLQEEMIKVTAASAEYNTETGQFKIGTQQMYRLKAMAKELNLNYDELAKSAIKAAKEQRIMSEIPGFGAGMKEEEKQLIASMAEMKDGKWQVQLPGTQDWVKVQELTQGQLDTFTNMQTEMDKTDSMKLTEIGSILQATKDQNEILAKEQRTQSEKLTAELTKVANSVIYKAGKGTGDKFADTLFDSRITSLQAMTTALEGRTTSVVEAFDKIVTKMNTTTGDYLTGGEFGVDLEDVINKMKGAATKIDEVWDAVKTKITSIEANDIYIPSDLKGGSIVTGSFGQFTMNPKDDFLAAPDLDSFVNNAQGAFSILNTMQNSDTNKLQTLQEILTKNMSLEIPTTEVTPNIKTETIPNIINVNKTTEIQNNLGTNMEELLTKNINLENLTKAVDVNNKTTNEVTGNVGVNGDVKIKVEGLQGSLAQILDSDPNFQRMFKENVMTIVNERLSKSYGEKLGNLS